MEVTSSPRITVAIGPSISRPGSPLPMASGKSPKPVTSAVIKMRANRRLYLGVPILNSSRNCKFITRKLWGFYDLGGAFMHHGKFTTAREAVEAHNGEALAQRVFEPLLSCFEFKRQIGFLIFLPNPGVSP